MSKSKGVITPAFIQEFFEYCPKTGLVSRKKTYNPSLVCQKKAVGYKTKDGYIYTRILGKLYPLHRVIWVIVYGLWPDQKDDIDHINGIRDDNRICNLRCVSHQINLQNQRKCQPFNKNGLLGVSLHHGKFRARIWINRKVTIIGVFDTKEEAHEEYLKTKRQLHAGCTI